MRRSAVWCVLWAMGLCAGAPAQEPGAVVPLLRAHAHNDYQHERPLLDALDCGFCSVEADIHLVDGQLLVAHDLKDVKPERTLQALYLDPLLERVRANGGSVFPDGPPVTLLIDLKSDGRETFLALRDVLEGYRGMLTVFTDDEIREGAVTVIVSGSADGGLVAEGEKRLAGLDGRPETLEGDAVATDAPLISQSWRSLFTWNGRGDIPAEDLARMRDLVARTHARGMRLRFWGLPHGEAVWRVLLDEGVDLINADDLEGLRDFLLAAGADG